ncbi:hypothetical protein EBZ70_05765 [bacterium]|jgi:hypothetical protein|nr:hypothetical protein [bacterium]
MSLNRSEQMVHDYLLNRPEERRHWEELVKRKAEGQVDIHAAATVLERELWRYFQERAEVAEPFRSFVRREGGARTSMRSLAELLLRLWVPLSAKPKPSRLPFEP